MMILKNPKSVLIVDDDTAILKLCAVLFIKWGFTVYTASEREIALKIAKEQKVDLILLDINLGTDNGLEICKLIKKTKQIKNIPVFFITGLSNRDLADEAIEVGGVAFVLKPIIKMQLKSKVEEALKIKNLEDLKDVSEKVSEIMEKIDNGPVTGFVEEEPEEEEGEEESEDEIKEEQQEEEKPAKKTKVVRRIIYKRVPVKRARKRKAN